MPKSLEFLLSQLSKDQNLLHSVEEATKQGAVLPILNQLGWNCFNVQEVVPEFSAGTGRIDYCLCINQKNAVFIEVKRTTETLERHEKQLLDYSFEYGVDIAILTNGLLWWFYLPLAGGEWHQRKFFTIDIRQQNPSAAAKHFEEFLNRNSLADGSAIKKAKSIKKSREKNKSIIQTIPKAWEQLLEEPDELLLELLADKVESICGYRADLEILTDFIHEKGLFKNQTSPDITQTKKPTPTKRRIIMPDTTKYHPSRKSAKRKGAIVTVGNKTIKASTVGDLYYQALEYICDNDLIRKAESKIPYATSQVRFLIAKEPIHQRGNNFRAPIEYKGYYMETHKNYEQALKHLEDFLKECGLRIKY